MPGAEVSRGPELEMVRYCFPKAPDDYRFRGMIFPRDETFESRRLRHGRELETSPVSPSQPTDWIETIDLWS